MNTHGSSGPPLLDLARCEAKQGYFFGFSQPVILGTLALKADTPVPVGRIDATMQALIRQLDPHFEPPDRPKDTLGFVSWLLDWSHRLQRAHGVVVVQSPRILSQEIHHGRHLVDFATPYFNATIGVAALRWVVQIVHGLLRGPHDADQSELEEFSRSLRDLSRRTQEHTANGINVGRMLTSATENAIPFIHMGLQTFLIGQGVRSRWIRSSFTDATSYLGTVYARDKSAAATVLRFHGLPVAEHQKVNDADEAVRVASNIGYPVVVKAADLDGGVGVHAGLRSPGEVVRCFEEARGHTRNVLVERFHTGNDYRLTILHGEVVKAIQRFPGGVTGDGRHTVADLLHMASKDEQSQRRMRERGKVMLQLDGEAMELLQGRGLGPDSVLTDGEFVALRRRANVSTGGSTQAVEVETIHPENRLLAVRAAAALRLDVAGVDLIVPDIRRSWLETGGIVCEVNGQPQFGENKSPGLYLQFFRRLLAGDGRIPITVIACAAPPRSGVVTRWRSAFSRGRAGDALVFDGLLFLNDAPLSRERRTTYEQACAAMASREVRRALIVMSLRELADHGLPVQRVDAVALVRPPAPHPETGMAMEAVRTAIEQHVARAIHFTDEEAVGNYLHDQSMALSEGLHSEREHDLQ